MALGLRLRVTNTQDRSVIERTFDRFPVRIGRNPLNDCQLDSPFVSQFHAVLELNGNQLMLRDLGSKNGTMLRGQGKLQAHAVVDLGPSNYEFAISSLFFQAFPYEVPSGAMAPSRKKATLFLQDSLPASIAGVPGTGYPVAPPGAAGGNPAVAATMEKLKPFYDSYRGAWGQFYQNLCLHAGTLDPPSRARLLEELNMQAPAVGFEPDFQRLAQVFKANLPPSAVGAGAKQDEMLALQAVKELAHQWLPDRSLEGPEAITHFLSKLQDAFDVFLKTFIPLRDGYKQFETKMEIKRGGTARAGAVQRTVETAKDPKELARILLDPQEPSNDAPRTIEGIFADLMIHQVAMLDGVMRGVKSLLQELSPQQIESLAERKKVGGGFFGGKNYEALWKVYAERHSDLADEEKEAFGLIFGPQFVQAYTQLSGQGGGTERQTGGRPAFPMPTGGYPAVQPSQPSAGQNPSGQYQAVPQPPPMVKPPPPRDPNAPNPFEWPPRDPNPPKRGGY